MRRLLVVCAVTFAVLAVYFAVLFLPGHLPGAQAPRNFDLAAADTAAQPTVVADHISVRALGLNALVAANPSASSALSAPLYLTNSSAADRLFALGTANLLPVAGTGVAGSLGDGGAAIAAQIDLAQDSLVERSGIAIAPDGTIFIADTLNSTIRRIAGPSSTEPGIIRSIAGRWAARQNISLTQPMGIALDSAGNLYIADHAANSVLELVAATGQLEILAHVASPASVAVTPEGSLLYVASPETGAIYAVKPQSRGAAIVQPVAGFAAVQTPASAGQCSSVAPGATSGAASGAAAESANAPGCPAGLAADRAGNLFVADAASGSIVRIAAGNFARTTIASALAAPGEIALSASGDLFVSEEGRERLLVLPQVVPPSNITLTGPGAVSAYNFANEPTGGTGPAQTFTLTNNSATAVTGVSFAISPAPANFAVSNTSCTASLAAHASCTASVEFTPSTTGALSGSITATDATSASDSSSVALTGTGNDFSIQVANGQPIEVSTIQGGTATFNLVLMPSGNFGTNGEKVSFTCPPAAPPADVSVPGSMPAATTCLITPGSVNVTPGTSTTFQAMFTTVAPTVKPITGAIPGAPFFGGRSPDGLTNVLLVFCAILSFAGALALRRTGKNASVPWRSRTFSLVSACAACLVLVTFVAGCKTHPIPVVSTPTGEFPLTIQAQALNSSGQPLNAARSVNITLDVISN